MKKLPALKFLIEECKFNFVKIKAGNGGNLFHEACLYGATDIAKYLLNQGSDVNAKNNDGKTARKSVKSII